jgi:preprotein translocase subunit SecE
MNINFKNHLKKSSSFFKEVKLELKKVNWPTRNETVKYTLIVIGASVAVAAFLGALDFVFQFLLNKFIIR